MVNLNNIGSWTKGLSSSSSHDARPSFDFDRYAQQYLEKEELRREKARSRERSKSDAVVRRKIEDRIDVTTPAPSPSRFSGEHHMSGISDFLSYLITSSDPHRYVFHGGYAAKTPKGQPAKQPPKSFIGNYHKFTEIFIETAPAKYGTEIFRKHQNPAEKVLKDYKAENAKKALEHAWPKMREILGFEGDCRYPWEKVADMNLAEIVAVQAATETQIDLPSPQNLAKVMRAIFDYPVSEDALAAQQKTLKIAVDKLESVMAQNIYAKATRLSHHDLGAIRNWGKEFDHARVEALRELHDNTIRTALHTDEKLGLVNAELVKLLRAKKPGGLMGVFAGMGKKKFESGIAPIEKDANGTYQWVKEPVDYRLMSDEDKKKAEEQLVQELENVMRETMEHEDDRIAYAESAAEVAGRYQAILNQHRRALNKNRTRILSDARDGVGLKANTDEDAIVSGDKVKHAQSAIDDRIEALDESAQICEREREHYESIAALHQDHKKNLRMAVNHSLERLRDFERKQQQVVLTQNIALAGQYGHNLQNMSIEKQIKAVTERLQEARAEEVEKLSAMKKAMDTDEILVLDYQAPIALIEHQKTLALPAPDAPD